MTILEYLRREQHLSQLALATRASVQHTLISLLETRTLKPKPDELERIAQVLGVAPAVLLREVKVDLQPDAEQTAEAQP